MKFNFSSTFGQLEPIREGAHTGVDIPLADGTTLRSVVDGTIYAIRDYGAQNIGKGVVIHGDDGNYYIYGHMSEISVEKGMEINAGSVIGESGNTGHVVGENGGYHLHFGVQQPDGTFINPEPMLERLEGITGDKEPLEIVNALTSTSDAGFWEGVKEFFLERGQVDQYSEIAKNEETGSVFWDWVGGHIGNALIHLWHWFIINLPDIMGYTTILMGILIILGSMMGKGGFMKMASIYAGLLILALCILGGV